MYFKFRVFLFVFIFASISLFGFAIAKQQNIDCTRVNSSFNLLPENTVVTIDSERWNFLRDELGKIAFGESKLSSKCQLNIHIQIRNINSEKDKIVSPIENISQSFRIIRDKKNIENNEVNIHAYSSLGALYGVYEILDILGVRYYSTNVTTIPENLDWSLLPYEKTVTPIMPLRGTWTFGKNLDKKFLLWAGRNRFNLIGGDFTEGESYRRIFGISTWTGGHDVISRLTPTDRLIQGKKLAEVHPEWFGGNTDVTQIPFGSDTYTNPCFGESGYVEHFANALIEEILTGVYRDSKFINIWPSDQIKVTVPKNCRHAPGSENGLGDFVYFIKRVSLLVEKNFRLSSIEHRPIILGISYQGDYDLSQTNIILNSSDAQNYLHLFYQDLRSHAASFFDTSSSVNRQIAIALEGTVQHHNLKKFGVVEYHGFSVYRGMFLGASEQYSQDIRAYAEKGAVLYAYMHPSKIATVPEILLNRTISRTLFGGDIPQSIIKDFRLNILGDDSQVIRAFELYEAALRNKTEFFGSNLSLYMVLWYDVFWDPPLLSAAQAKEIMNKYMLGGVGSLPSARMNWPKYHNVKLPSFWKALLDLDSAENTLNKIIKSNNNEIIKNLYLDIKRSNLIHKIFLQLFYIRSFDTKNNSYFCKYTLNILSNDIEKVLSYNWPEYVSEFDIKKSYSNSLKVMIDKLSSSRCIK